MKYRAILAGALLAVCASSLADSWDSSKNVERAMSDAVNTYRSAGEDGLVAASENCYAGLDTGVLNKHRGRDVEYCISHVLAAAVISKRASRASQAPQNAYFTSGELLIKAMHTLETARMVTRPEEFMPYLNQRMTKIEKDMPPLR